MAEGALGLTTTPLSVSDGESRDQGLGHENSHKFAAKSEVDTCRYWAICGLAVEVGRNS